MFALLPAGERRITEILVADPDATLCTPRGSCRQRLAELATADTPVHICAPAGVLMSTTLGELLPYSFGGAKQNL